MIKHYISTVYRGEVVVPFDVYDTFGHTKEYEVFSSSLMTKCNVGASGQNSYDAVIEWCEDSDKRCVHNWVSQWVKQIEHWQTRLNEGEEES